MSKRSGKKVVIKFRPFVRDNPKAKIRGTWTMNASLDKSLAIIIRDMLLSFSENCDWSVPWWFGMEMEEKYGLDVSPDRVGKEWSKEVARVAELFDEYVQKRFVDDAYDEQHQEKAIEMFKELARIFPDLWT